MATVLITGANRGLGLAFARRYAADGHDVVATCRDPEGAAELRGLERVRVEPLDVADADAPRRLAERLGDLPVDLLVNNAGVSGGDKVFESLDDGTLADVLEVDLLGPLRVTAAFVEHVARSRERKVVAITSRMGSLAEDGAGYLPYRTSKAALNMAMRVVANALRPRGIVVLLLHPGWVRTDMGGAGATLSPEESVAGMARVIAAATLDRSGRFLDHSGASVPW